MRINALDSVRGIAAVIVLLHHELLLVPAFSDFFWSGYRADVALSSQPADVVFSSQPLTYLLCFTPLRLLWAGHQAVVLFFVLSGFVLALPWVNGQPPPYPAFVTRRICRIYLPYLAAGAVAAILISVIPHHESDPETLFHYGDWNNHGITTATLVNYLLMLGGQDQVFVDKVTWSLVHEMRVSLLFPLLVVPIVRWRLWGAAAVLASLLVLFAAAPSSPAWLSPPSTTFEYAMFCALGAAIAQRRTAIRAALAEWSAAGRAALLCLGLALMWRPLPLADIAAAIGACVVICAALSPGLIERVLTTPVLRWLGKGSYSLYLVHVPVLLAMYYLARDAVPLPVILVGAFPVALWAAGIFHRTVEAPAMRLGRLLTCHSTIQLRASIP